MRVRVGLLTEDFIRAMRRAQKDYEDKARPPHQAPPQASVAPSTPPVEAPGAPAPAPEAPPDDDEVDALDPAEAYRLLPREERR